MFRCVRGNDGISAMTWSLVGFSWAEFGWMVLLRKQRWLRSGPQQSEWVTAGQGRLRKQWN